MTRYVFVSPDTSFSSWRTHWPAHALELSGAEVDVLGVGSKTKDISPGPGDVVVVQVTNQSTRTVNPDGSLEGVEHFVRYVQSGGARCVLNLDDDYIAHRDIQSVDSTWYTPFIADLAAGMRAASMVVTATPVLEAVYAKWARRITTVRNYLPEVYWKQALKEREFDVCWMGYIGTEDKPMPHRRDFAEILPALGGLTLLTIGDEANMAAMLNRADAAGVWKTPLIASVLGPQPQVVPPPRPSPLYQEMSSATLGLCPLAENNFNASKSWIKALEFASQGTIPVVPAWAPAYQEFADVVPTLVYDGVENLRGIIDGALGASETDRMSLSAMIRGVSTDLSLEVAGVKEWQRAMALLEA